MVLPGVALLEKSDGVLGLGPVRRKNRKGSVFLRQHLKENAHLTETLHEGQRKYLQGEEQVYPLPCRAGILVSLMC